ncbi:MAG: hypothetical protein HKN57_13645 [Xanthomonadales bacterium]|nr:hypothetical protein [Gammaproteobacteria bacterium]NND58284.1 hypothetical protein [Xanthomonadales bacterium]NNK52005.1 hypothetical protein [Xanthomonadales bacterium]
MLDEHTLDLINADIDGELTPEESQELDATLEVSEEARAMRSELLRLSNLLDNQPAMQPPSDLSTKIMQQLLPQASKTRFSLAGWFSSFQPATAGVAFAAGLLATISFYELSQPGNTGLDTAGMVGTMVANPEGLSGEQTDIFSIAEKGVTGTVSLQTGNDYFTLEFDLDSDDPIEIEVDFAEAGLGFGGIAHAVIGTEETDQSYEVAGGALRVVNQGRQAFTVFLRRVAENGNAGREINVVVSSGGAPVVTGALRG